MLKEGKITGRKLEQRQNVQTSTGGKDPCWLQRRSGFRSGMGSAGVRASGGLPSKRKSDLSSYTERNTHTNKYQQTRFAGVGQSIALRKSVYRARDETPYGATNQNVLRLRTPTV